MPDKNTAQFGVGFTIDITAQALGYQLWYVWKSPVKNEFNATEPNRYLVELYLN